MSHQTHVLGSPLGRFEYIQGGSNKFWECLHTLDGTYLTRWGRIGAKPGKKGGLSAGQANAKIREKLREGYQHIAGSPTSLEEITARGLNAALDAIMTPAPAAPVRRRL